MKMRLLAILLLVCGALTAPAAQARDVRFPDTGYPAFAFHVPDDWAANPDGDGNLLVIAPDHSTVFALSAIPYTGTLDDLASGSMKVAKASEPVRGEAASMSGYGGTVYRSAMTNGQGVHINVKMTAIKVGSDHAVTCTLLYADATTSDQLAAAQAVQDNMAILPQPSR